MSHLLRVTDYTTTIALSESDQLLLEYTPVPTIDGTSRETVKVGFGGSTPLTTLRNLTKLLEQARRNTAGEIASPVYAEFDPGASGTYYRGKLVDAQINYDTNTLGEHWGTKFFEVTISWEREMWEGPEVELPLASGGAKATGGVTVYVHDDSTHNDYLDIAAVDVEGDAPAPIRLEMTHTSATAGPMADVFVFHNTDASPTTFDHTLQAESASGGSNVAHANSSNGNYKTLSWSTTAETKLLEWSLPSALLEAAKGGRFALGIRLKVNPGYTNLYLRFKIMTTSPYYLLWEGDAALYQNPEYYQIIDVTKLPPGLPRMTGYSPLALELYGRRATAGTHTLDVDFVNLMPLSDTSGSNIWLTVASGIVQNEKFIADSIEDRSYRLDASSKAMGEFTHYGSGIYLVPGIAQRLIVSSRGSSSTNPLSQTWSVRAYYRPRRVAL